VHLLPLRAKQLVRIKVVPYLFQLTGLTDEMMAMIGEDEELHYLLKLHHFV
jgi:hypothetical protein